MSIRISLIYVIIFYTLSCFAQKEGYVWYFGDSVGIDFTSGSPVVVLLNDKLDYGESGATICDKNGNVLMYTNGKALINRNNDTMVNGTDLNGSKNSFQVATILPTPDKNNEYYVFTTNALGGGSPEGFYYSVVDLTLDNGNGAVTLKNQQMIAKATEELSVALHCNRKDYWILAQGKENDSLYAFLLTKYGITQKIISNTGFPTGNSPTEWIGQMSVNKDFDQVVLVNRNNNAYEVYNFNNSNGQFSAPVFVLPFDSGVGAGTAFSPDGNRLYVTEIGGIGVNRTIFQYDLTVGTQPAIIASKTVIWKNTISGTPPGNFHGMILEGPDERLYISRLGLDSVAVINNPNTLGIGCNYDDRGLYLQGREGHIGFSNTWYYLFTPEKLDLSSGTNADSVFFCKGNVMVLDASIEGAISYVWKGGSIDSTITIDSTGTYWVEVSLTCGVVSDTINAFFVVPQFELGSDTAICETDSIILGNGASELSYVWSTGQTDSVIIVKQSGQYSVTITDTVGCTAGDTVNITVDTNYVLQTNLSDTSFCLGASYALELSVNPISSGKYFWSPTGDTSNNIIVSIPENYKIILSNGCQTDSASILVTEEICNIFIPNSINLSSSNNIFQIYALGAEDIRLTIYDRMGKKLFEELDITNGWDGSYENKPISKGVYVYEASLKFTNVSSYLYRGNLTVME